MWSHSQTVCTTYGLIFLSLLFLLNPHLTTAHTLPRFQAQASPSQSRSRTSLNTSWRFNRFLTTPDSLTYSTLKPWLLPSSNSFISGTPHSLPSGTPPGNNISYVQPTFDDSSWETVNIPHDWAIQGPFNAPGIVGEMGRLPVDGVGWYRRNVTITATSTQSVFLDIDGAMSYAAVWLNENLVGGWPYGYASFRLDLTPYVKSGEDNLLAIRLDNAKDSSRWYPGAGIYRNVWLVMVNEVRVGQYGTFITTPTVSAQEATLNLMVEVENNGGASKSVDVVTEVFAPDPATGQAGGDVVATFSSTTVTAAAGSKVTLNSTTTVTDPLLWGPPPAQKPNLYVAITTLSINSTIIDTYSTPFGIRSVTYDSNKGILVNNLPVRIQGTNNHHDQGSLGSAFHTRAAERQLQILQEMGANAMRTSHNPPAPEFLDLADKLGFLVLDEIFDCWNSGKSTNDFHLIFADWHEADLRSFIRRDRNHPSVIVWSFGNEIKEQSSSSGGALAQPMHDMIHAEDSTRPATASMNVASAGSSFANVMDLESLNYQGEGIGSSMSSSFPSFHTKYPNKLIWSSESAAALSSRGTYLFPVTSGLMAAVANGSGGNSTSMQISSYELYGSPNFGMSPDKVFEQQDKNPFAAGEFVWSGFDYLGEPTPYDSARSSYYGIIDLAGFKKDRFYLYQSRWRPELPMAHILPHWTWPERIGEVTPVHVFSAADEAELFVNGKSAGRLQKPASYTYRFRWDNVTYQPGDLRVVTYMNGTEWATDTKQTAGAAAQLNMTADQTIISGDGYDLSYITVSVLDSNGTIVPRADNAITFSISGPGQIVATDNGDPTDVTVFPSVTRKAFSGLALAIFRSNTSSTGHIVVTAAASGLVAAQVNLQVV